MPNPILPFFFFTTLKTILPFQPVMMQGFSCDNVPARPSSRSAFLPGFCESAFIFSFYNIHAVIKRKNKTTNQPPENTPNPPSFNWLQQTMNESKQGTTTLINWNVKVGKKKKRKRRGSMCTDSCWHMKPDCLKLNSLIGIFLSIWPAVTHTQAGAGGIWLKHILKTLTAVNRL